MPPRRWPDPLPLDLEVLLLELDLKAPLPQDDQSCLHDDEHERAARLYRHEDRVRFVRTRAALRRLLGLRLRRCPRELRFMVNRYGKPALHRDDPDAAAVHFNVSHAGAFALLAVSARVSVGVDIEWRDAALDVRSLQPQILSDLEWQLSAEQRPDFFECWTAKEAVLKCLGLGVAEHLRQVSVTRPVHGDVYGVCHEAMAWPRVAVRRLQGPEGYEAAVAWTPEAMEQS